jgi:hypothetical protein
VEAKETYTLGELFDLLPIPLVKLAELSEINEVTLARIRDGRVTRRSTANKLLNAMSKVYERPLDIYNVTGINVQGRKQKEATAAMPRAMPK